MDPTFGTEPAIAALEARSETPQSAIVKEELVSASEQKEHDAIIMQLKKRLKEKIKICTTQQEQLRALDAQSTVLRTEKTSEQQQHKQYSKDLSGEKAKILELRRQFTNKGKEHVRNLKRIHELDTTVKAALFKEEALDESTKHSKEVTRATKDKLREGQRQLEDLKFDRSNTRGTLESTMELTHTFREQLQKKDFEIIRENYGYRVQIEGLKRIVAERTGIIDSLTSDKVAIDQEVKRMSLLIETIREEAGRIIAELRARIEGAELDSSNLTDRNNKVANSIMEKEDNLEELLTREVLLKKQNDTEKGTIQALHKSVNEGHANVTLSNNRVKDCTNEIQTTASAVSDAQADLQLLKEKLENVQYVSDETNTALAKESAHVKKLMMELEQEMEMDKSHGDHLRRAKLFAKEVEEKVLQMSAAEAAAYSKLNVVQTKVDIMKKDIAVLQRELQNQQRMIEDKLEEGERLSRSVQQKDQELGYLRSTFAEQSAELSAVLAAKEETIERVKRAIVLTDAKNDSIKNMMDQTGRVLREDRDKLECRIKAVQAQDAGLTGQLHDAEEKQYEIKLALDTAEERDIVMQSKVDALKKEMHPLQIEFDAQIVTLEDKVKKKERELYDLEENVGRTRTEGRVMQQKLDEEVEQEVKLRAKVRVQQVRRAAAADEYEITKALEAEDENTIKEIEGKLQALEANLDAKTAECDAYHDRMKEAENVTSFQERMIRDEQAGQSKMKQALMEERDALAGIDRIIKIKEGQFENDANAVTERLLAYKNMLVERSENANRLDGKIGGELQDQKINRAKLEEVAQLMDAEKEQFDDELSARVREKDEYKSAVGDKDVAIMQANAEIQRSAEAVSDCRIKLDGTQNEVEVLKDEVDLTRREAKQLELQLETRGAYERELFDSMMMKDQTIKLLETQLADAEGVDNSLHAQLRALEHEQKMLQSNIDARKASQDTLINELESAKMRFSTVAPIDDVKLQTSMHRAEQHRAEYANTLLKIVGGEVR